MFDNYATRSVAQTESVQQFTVRKCDISTHCTVQLASILTVCCILTLLVLIVIAVMLQHRTASAKVRVASGQVIYISSLINQSFLLFIHI
jgi:hypothetical protein